MQPLGRVTYISICTGINLHPIVKPFEMVGLWGVIERSIFLFDHQTLESWNFSHFQIKFHKFWTLVASESTKNFFENFWKNDEFFSFIFVFIMISWLCYVPQTWYDTRKYIFKVIKMCVKLIKKSKISKRNFLWKMIKNYVMEEFRLFSKDNLINSYLSRIALLHFK